MENRHYIKRDMHVLWHPCTQMKDHETIPLIPIRRAQGLYLEDMEGQHYMDAVGSWWVNLLGHNHPYITAAIQEQVGTLSHVMFAGFTHEPAIQLAERLVQLSPPGLSRVFYGDSGATAIEIALKMSYHAWHNQGYTHKKRFMALSHGYHGETLGALSVTDVDLFKKQYADLLFDPILIPCSTRTETDDAVLADVRRLMEIHADETCALIVEPLVQCAAGIRMHSAYFLGQLHALTREFNIHLIADEIAVGFGRTGTLFACEQAAITPDFMCVSKGLTGGYLSLSAVLTTEHIYQSFYDEYHTGKAFLHSHSYTGNALACRAALATLDVLINEQWVERNKKTSAHFNHALQSLRAHPHVCDVRQQGMIIAMNMQRNRTEPYPAQERRGMRVYMHALKQGVLLRPLGNVVYFMPAYCITFDEIDRLCAVALESIDVATGESL